MATSNPTFAPYITTVAQGMFNTQSVGLRQGTAYQSPNARWNLRGGILDAAETIPMWGGVGVYMNVPGAAGTPRYELGPVMGRASALTGSKALAGFSVFDQNYAMFNFPQSPVPLIGSGGQVNAYPLGSGARIAVQADASLVSLRGGAIGANVSWDFVNQLLVPYNASPLTVSSGTYDGATGIVTLTMSAPINFGPGVDLATTLTGTGSIAQLNGNFTAVAPSSGSTVSFVGPTGLTLTITGGTLTLGSGSASALPCKVLDVQITNCETVVYNSTTGFATWNYNGCCAVIQI